MAAQTSMLHIRIDEDMKEQATHTLDALGMTMADAVRLFLHRVITDEAFPLELKVPNAQTRAAMKESRAAMKAQRSRFGDAKLFFNDLEKNSRK